MKIAVVGTCASGKSTVVAELRRRGFDAYVVSQEHSIVRDLWRRSAPDFLVMLEADHRSICRRRGRHWPRWLYDLQRERLCDARDHADVVANTSSHTIDETVDLIVELIGERWQSRADLRSAV